MLRNIIYVPTSYITCQCLPVCSGDRRVSGGGGRGYRCRVRQTGDRTLRFHILSTLVIIISYFVMIEVLVI